MSGKRMADVMACPAGRPDRDIPRFMVSGGGFGMVLVCQWCDGNIVMVGGDVDFADLMEAVAVHSGSADRARDQARTMLAGLAPGATGIALADEVADKVVAAYLGIETPQ